MHDALKKTSLSPSRVRLLEIMQEINFGRLEDLIVQGGEPHFDPPPKVVKEIKFGGDNGPRTERFAGDFYLKIQVTDLFAQIEQLGDATISCLEIKRGLPFRMMVESTEES